jgi:hypothetical protein
VLDDLDGFKYFVDSPEQVLRSDYLHTIELYKDFFDPSQILLGYFDAIIDQPEMLLTEILGHIGARQVALHANLGVINNKSKEVQMPRAYREYLVGKYYPEIEKISSRYGGYASKWLASCKLDEFWQTDGDIRLPPVAYL